MPDDKNHSEDNLVRALGKWDLTALGVNQVIGSGIFVLPATIAVLVGAGASPLVWIAAAVVNALIVLCFAEAGTRFRQAGGPYLYAREAFGPFAGFEVAWMLWLTRVSSQATLANAFAIYVAYFWSGAGYGIGRVVVITSLLGCLAAINVRGVRQGSWTVNFFTVSKLVPLSLFIVVGLFFIDWGAFSKLAGLKPAEFGQGVLLLMFAFGGYELIGLPAGEAKSPRRDVPIALLMTIVIVALFFVAVQIVAVGTLPTIGETETPIADAADAMLGPAAGLLIALGGLLSITGSNAGTMLAGPRVTFAMGGRRQLPKIFAHAHERFRTPDFSIFFYSAVALVLALSGSFRELAEISAVARLVFYAGTCAAVPRLRRRSDLVEGGFRLPGGPLIPALALFCSAALLFGAGSKSLLAGAAALLVGALFYLGQRRSER